MIKLQSSLKKSISDEKCVRKCAFQLEYFEGKERSKSITKINLNQWIDSVSHI